MKTFNCILWLGLMTSWLLQAKPALADARRFVWNYETTTAPVGFTEYEQWATWKTDKKTDARYDRWEFRHEFEYGLTRRLQVGIYLADWRYTRTSLSSDTQVRSTSVEVIYNLAHPMTSALGVALYGEVALGQEKFALEGKLLLEKPLGNWLLVGNTVFEGEWEDADWVRDTAKFEQTVGLSRQFSPRFMLGLEGVYEVEFPDWSDPGPSLFYLGPNLSWRSRTLWLTAAPLFQLSNLSDEPNLMWRTLVGFPL